MINRNVLRPDNIVLRVVLVQMQVPKPGLQAGCGFKVCLLGLLRKKKKERCVRCWKYKDIYLECLLNSKGLVISTITVLSQSVVAVIS